MRKLTQQYFKAIRLGDDYKVNEIIGEMVDEINENQNEVLDAYQITDLIERFNTDGNILGIKGLLEFYDDNREYHLLNVYGNELTPIINDEITDMYEKLGGE